MTPANLMNLLSAILGAIGTLILFANSYALQPLEGAVWGGDEVTAENDRIKAQNLKRLKMQRVGLVFVCLAFCSQAASVFL